MALGAHILNAAIVLSCALTAVFLRFRNAPDLRAGLTWVGFGLVAGGIASLTPALAYASAVGFEDDKVHVVTETSIAVLCCTFGLAVGAYSWLHGTTSYDRGDAAGHP